MSVKEQSDSRKIRAETLRALGIALTIPFGNNMLIYLCGFDFELSYIKIIQIVFSLICLYAANQIIGYAKWIVENERT